MLTKLQENAETGDPAVKKLTPGAFSARISQRDDWKACRHREGGDKCTRLYRTNGCPAALGVTSNLAPLHMAKPTIRTC